MVLKNKIKTLKVAAPVILHINGCGFQVLQPESTSHLKFFLGSFRLPKN